MYPAILFLRSLDLTTAIFLRKALFSSKSVPKFSGYLSKISFEMRLILFIHQNDAEAKFIFIENIGWIAYSAMAVIFNAAYIKFNPIWLLYG
jgi:hypothetical protein